MWHYSRKGISTVKSTYHIQQRDRSSSSSSQCVSEMVWENLWRILFMPKVCNFLCRILHNDIAVGENLIKKKIPVDKICPVWCISWNYWPSLYALSLHWSNLVWDFNFSFYRWAQPSFFHKMVGAFIGTIHKTFL